MTTATQPAATLTLLLEQIHVPDNVRELDPAHVSALAGSISLQGLLVPVVVRSAQDGYELVAGFHRVAAALQLGLSELPVVIRDVDSEDADRAVENIASCRRRHDVIYADRVVMPTSGWKSSHRARLRHGVVFMIAACCRALSVCGDCRSLGWKVLWRPTRRASAHG